MTIKDKPALVLIYIQKGFEDIEFWGGHRNNLQAEENAFRLLDFWRQNSLPIFHIKHCSTNPDSRLAEGQPGNEFKEIVMPLQGETVIKKSENSAFIGTDLKKKLDDANIKYVIIVGLTTDHCVSTTARMAGNYGYKTIIISDATATFDKCSASGQKFSAEIIHEISLVSLHKEFASVMTTDEFIKELK